MIMNRAILSFGAPSRALLRPWSAPRSAVSLSTDSASTTKKTPSMSVLRPTFPKTERLERTFPLPYEWAKHRAPEKRANHLLSILADEEREASVLSKKALYPDFLPGDAIEVIHRTFASSKKMNAARGVVIGRRNRSINSTFKLLTVTGQQTVEYTFQLHDPLIDKIKLLTTAFIHKRRNKRVRRAKLYYLKRDPKLKKKYRVSVKTGEGMSIKQQLAKIEGGAKRKGGKKRDQKRKALIKKLKAARREAIQAELRGDL